MNSLCKKLFLSPYFFTIAIQRKQGDGVMEHLSFKAEYIIPATPDDWVADPILIDYEGNTFLFFEAVHKEKGRIEVVQVYDDCSVSQPTVIFEDEGHYSYPFVFKIKEEWYMIPETSCHKEVRLYRAIEFPYKWEFDKLLLQEKAVDTTVFDVKENKIMLTFLPKENSEKVLPKAYMFKNDERNVSLQPIQWDNYNELECRGAGQVFEFRKKMYRPAQISLEHRYGDKIAFYCIDNVTKEYKEHLECVLSPDNIFVSGWNIDGLHTYSATDKFEAIDIRCRKFDVFKVLRVLKLLFKRVMNSKTKK